LLHEPSILLLDEPSNGLDPAGIVEMRELFSDMVANKGVTIFISSHILGEIAKIATRIGIIHEGKLLQELNANELDTLRRKRLLLNAHDTGSLRHHLEAAGYSVGTSKEGHTMVTDPEVVKNPECLCEALVKAGIAPTMLFVDEEDLESYFLRIIGRQEARDE
jgi:ABC-2 type transport system ATP-binding protein